MCSGVRCLSLLAVAVLACAPAGHPVADAGGDLDGGVDGGEPDGGSFDGGASDGGGRDGGIPDAGADAGLALDEDGVEQLFPSAAGSSLRLGAGNPNSAPGFEVEQGPSTISATARVQGALHFWNLVSYPLSYASGGTGYTTRLHLHASGGTQHFTWKTQHGYLSSAADVRNQEFTAFVRVHQFLDAPHVQATLKFRGGAHSSSNGDLASCTMMTFSPGTNGSVSRFGKELFHPNYDYVNLTSAFTAALADNAWVGLKAVTWSDPHDATRTVNRLYVDTDPFDATTGAPRNGWRLFSEYVDVEGHSTGRYTKLADWGGWLTTLRVDGVHDLDFALLSVREIVPPG